MNVPQLRFSGFDGEWEVKRIKDIAPLQRGFDLVKENIVPGKYPIGYSNGILGYHNEYKAKGPGVFTGRSGTIGNIHFTESDYWPHNTSLWVTDFKGNNEKFIYYFYKKVDLKKYNAGSTVPTLNRNDVHDLKRAIPKREEQEKIATFLTLLGKRIEKQQEKIEKLEQFKKGMMQKIFSQELRFKDEDGGEFPEWEAHHFFYPVKKILDYRGKTPKKLGLDWGEGEIPALSANNVKMDKIDFEKECNLGSEELYERWMTDNHLNQGDVLMTMEAPLGMVAQVPDNRRYILSQRVIALKINEEICSNDYFAMYLRSPAFQQILDKMSTGSTAKGINQKNLSKMKIKIPCQDEQTKIAGFLKMIDKKVVKEKERLMVLEEQKRGFMQGMFV